MKNHIAFKFIAVLLCAVSLLGAIGSAAGIFVLTETDLYNRTVDELIEDRIQGDGYSYSNELALRYASENLGGCSYDMADSYYGYHWFVGNYDPSYYGYSLLDAESNVIDSFNADAAGLEDAVTYSFPVSGQYMYLVSAIPESEKYPQASAELIYGEDYVYDAIPSGGVVVQGFSITQEDGSEGIAAPEGLGTLTYNEKGEVVFESFQPITISDTSQPILHISFQDMHGDIVYEAASPNGVGRFSVYYTEEGDTVGPLVFTVSFSDSTDSTPVYQAFFYDLNHTDIYHIRSDEPIGTFFYDENGYATLQIDLSDVATYVEQGALKPGYVGGVSLYGADSREFYDLYSADGIGFVYQDEAHQTIFVANVPVSAEESAAAAETQETVPEETAAAETAPAEAIATIETAGETSPETAEVTTPETTEAPAEETVPSSASALPEPTAVEETTAPETDIAAEETAAPEVSTQPTVAETIPEETAPEETVPETTEPILINGKSLDEYGLNNTTYYNSETGETMYAQYVYVPMPEYTVELYVSPRALRYESAYTVLEIVRYFRNYLFPALGICLLVFAIFAVYLCCAAARKPKSEEIHAGGLNCLPLDLYLALGAIGITGLAIAGVEGGEYLLRQNVLVGCAFAVAMAFLASLIIVGFCFALVAQIKTPGGYWWRNTLCGHCIRLIIRFCLWLKAVSVANIFPALGRLLKAVWNLIHKCILWAVRTVKRFCGWLSAKCNRFFSMLPLTWQWLLVGFVLVLWLLIAVDSSSEGMLFVWVCAALAAVLYGAHCFGTLLESAKRMSKGDLDTKVEDKLMVGSFEDFAGELNALAGVAVIAAQKQLKSERMKTELITNVSHDIKTPLTSIINYVDLLQKPHTDDEQEIYLEVLSRQSLRLKKLIDDLMEMSKASTGNMAVEVTRVDAVESINQALGEFADKLDKAQLTPVFRRTEESVAMMADGRLVWRVMSNLLSNAVKYALPGTRLYIDLMELEGKVVISLKNISRDELNVEADELMERFVRGDDSRNTEGSGLGLNIAKSLMELQKGQLQLLVDGDLFKVTLIFPGA